MEAKASNSLETSGITADYKQLARVSITWLAASINQTEQTCYTDQRKNNTMNKEFLKKRQLQVVKNYKERILKQINEVAHKTDLSVGKRRIKKVTYKSLTYKCNEALCRVIKRIHSTVMTEYGIKEVKVKVGGKRNIGEITYKSKMPTCKEIEKEVVLALKKDRTLSNAIEQTENYTQRKRKNKRSNKLKFCKCMICYYHGSPDQKEMELLSTSCSHHIHSVHSHLAYDRIRNKLIFPITKQQI